MEKSLTATQNMRWGAEARVCNGHVGARRGGPRILGLAD